MDIVLPTELARRVDHWLELSQWEKSELGRALRRLGLSYGEIRHYIPVPKGTLSGWCRDVRLTSDQAAAILRRTGSRKGVPRDTQRRRRAEIDTIRRTAAEQARQLLSEPFWVAGTTLYWAEGTKVRNELSLANSDPRACRLFVAWTRAFHSRSAVFDLKLNLHADNDEPAARQFWRSQLDLPSVRFYKTYVKPDGTGHRRNHLPHGVCQVRLRRSADAWQRTMAWIEVLADWTDTRDC